MLSTREDPLLERAAAQLVGGHALRELDPHLMNRCFDLRIDLVALFGDDRALAALVEQPLCEPVDLRGRGVTPGEHAKVDPHFDRGCVVLAHGECHGRFHYWCNARGGCEGSVNLRGAASGSREAQQQARLRPR